MKKWVVAIGVFAVIFLIFTVAVIVFAFTKTKPAAEKINQKLTDKFQKIVRIPSDIVIAKYIVQEEPTVLTSHSSSEMVVYAGKRACEDGADAIIIENFDVVNVPGGYARQTPKVTIVGIRYRN